MPIIIVYRHLRQAVVQAAAKTKLNAKLIAKLIILTQLAEAVAEVRHLHLRRKVAFLNLRA